MKQRIITGIFLGIVFIPAVLFGGVYYTILALIAKAVLYRNGEELDADGTAYTYTWKLWNSAGTSVVKTYTGKSITVAKTDVTGKGVLMCEVSK